MTGKQIADNLRHSRRKWTTQSLFDGTGYCVTGLKLREAGFSNKDLRGTMGATWLSYAFEGLPERMRDSLEKLIELNDESESKQELIATLESREYRNRSFPLEACALRLKEAKKKHLSRQ